VNIERVKYYDDYIVIINIMYREDQKDETAQGFSATPSHPLSLGRFISFKSI